MQNEEFKQIFPFGNKNDAYAQYFTGQSYLQMLAVSDTATANVTFEPRCRNNWHIHHGNRQLLLCTAGSGWYQEDGKEARSLEAGDVVDIPAEVKHWHGAKKQSWFSHIAISVPKEGATNEWCEAVTDEEYEKLSI